ncbi:MAG: hypothetical protein MHPSP_000533, partial [Paramarteilia canceri]
IGESNVETQVKCFFASMLIHNELSFINPIPSLIGVNIIYDLKTLKYTHALQLISGKLRSQIGEFVDNVQRYPIRVKHIHIINLGTLARGILTVLLTLSPKKVRNRIKIHANYESLYNMIDRKILPKEYGGDGGSFDSIWDKNNAKLMANKIYIRSFEEFMSTSKK